MSTNEESAKSPELMAALCHELVLLARHEDDVAAREAARVPYWAACPPSIEGHRAAARALRADLERLDAHGVQTEPAPTARLGTAAARRTARHSQ
jgi:hypothetical protein